MQQRQAGSCICVNIKRAVKDPAIVNITVQKRLPQADETSTCYNYQITEKETRNRTFEDYQKSKKSLKRGKSQKDVRKYMGRGSQILNNL